MRIMGVVYVKVIKQLSRTGSKEKKPRHRLSIPQISGKFHIPDNSSL